MTNEIPIYTARDITYAINNDQVLEAWHGDKMEIDEDTKFVPACFAPTENEQNLLAFVLEEGLDSPCSAHFIDVVIELREKIFSEKAK